MSHTKSVLQALLWTAVSAASAVLFSPSEYTAMDFLALSLPIFLSILLPGLATSWELARMATKDDLQSMATKEDLLSMATKEDLHKGLDEAMAESKKALSEAMAEAKKDLNDAISPVLDAIAALGDKITDVLEDQFGRTLNMHRAPVAPELPLTLPVVDDAAETLSTPGFFDEQPDHAAASELVMQDRDAARQDALDEAAIFSLIGEMVDEVVRSEDLRERQGFVSDPSAAT